MGTLHEQISRVLVENFWKKWAPLVSMPRRFKGWKITFTHSTIRRPEVLVGQKPSLQMTLEKWHTVKRGSRIWDLRAKEDIELLPSNGGQQAKALGSHEDWASKEFPIWLGKIVVGGTRAGNIGKFNKISWNYTYSPPLILSPNLQYSQTSKNCNV